MTCLPIRTHARGGPFRSWLCLQADVAEGETRLIAPLAPHIGPLASAASRALPLIDHDDKRYAVTLPLISSLPRHQLRNPVGSLAPISR